MRIRRRLIRELVADLLKKFTGQHPPVNVEAIAKAQGIDVQDRRVEQEFSGFLLINPPSAPIIGVNLSHSEVRRRFTIAHEIGHFFLHANEGLHVDKGLLVIRHRNTKSSTGTDLEEIEANLFAAELLMPSDWLEADLQDGLRSNQLDDQLFADLAKKYRVSEQALTIRSSSLGYVPF